MVKAKDERERERDRESATARSGGRGGAVSEKFESRAALRQRVAHVLVGLGEELLLFVGAGERVTAVVGAHVERGVHRVGEVSGLRGTNHYQKPFGVLFFFVFF